MVPVATLTFSVAKVFATALGMSVSVTPAHDCAAARAAASEALTMARRLKSSCPTSTVRTRRPKSAKRLKTTMTALAPPSPFRNRRGDRFMAPSLFAAERPAQRRVQGDRRDERDVHAERFLNRTGEAVVVDRDRDRFTRRVLVADAIARELRARG